MDEKFAKLTGFTLEEVRSEAVQNSFIYARFKLREELKNLFIEFTKPLVKIMNRFV